MTVSAGLTAAVVAVGVEEAATGLGTLRNTIGVGVSVDINAGSVALEQRLVLHSPSDNTDFNSVIRPAVESSKTGNPLIIVGAGGFGDLLALSGSNGLG